MHSSSAGIGYSNVHGIAHKKVQRGKRSSGVAYDARAREASLVCRDFIHGE